MLTEEEFNKIDTVEEISPDAMPTLVNTNAGKEFVDTIDSIRTNAAKMIFKGLSNASFNVFTGLESLAGGAVQYATGIDFTEKEKEQYPLRSFLKPYREELNKIQYSGPGSGAAEIAEPIVQFAAASSASPTKWAKIPKLVYGTLSDAFAAGFAFNPDDPNAAELLTFFDNDITNSIYEEYKSSPDNEEWENRLNNMITDFVAAKSTKGIGKAGLVALNKAGVTKDKLIAALKYAFGSKRSAEITEQLSKNIDNMGAPLSDKPAFKPQEKALTTSELKGSTSQLAIKSEPMQVDGVATKADIPLREHTPMDFAEKYEKLKSDIKANYDVDPNQIDLEMANKIKSGGITQDVVDKSLLDEVVLENTCQNLQKNLNEIGEMYKADKINATQKTQLEVKALGKLFEANNAWTDDLSLGATAANIKSRNESAAAISNLADWLKQNAADGVRVSEVADFFRSIPQEQTRDALIMLSHNKKLQKGLTNGGKSSFGEIVDNLNALRQAVLLMSPKGVLKDFRETAQSIFMAVPETLGGSLISKAQHLKFKDPKNMLTKSLNAMSDFAFGSGEMTDPMAISEAFYQLNGIFKGYGDTLVELGGLAKRQKVDTMTSHIRQNLPETLSKYNEGRITSISLPKFKTAEGTGVVDRFKQLTNDVLEGVEAAGEKSFNIREAGDSINQSVAARAILEQRLNPLINKEFSSLSSAEKKAKFAELANKTIEMLPLAEEKRLIFNADMDTKLFSIAQDMLDTSTKQVFRDRLEGTSELLYKLHKDNDYSRVTKMISPFIRTKLAINIERALKERTPFGLAFKGIREQMAAGGRTAAMARSRMALGTLIGGMIGKAYFADNKIQGGYTNKQFFYNAGYAKTQSKREYEKGSGFIPYSLYNPQTNKNVQLTDVFGPVYGKVAEAGLRVAQTWLLHYNKINSQQNIKYDDNGYRIDPEADVSALFLGTMMSPLSYTIDNTFLSDLGDVAEDFENGNYDKIAKRFATIAAPTPPIVSEGIDAAAAISNAMGSEFFDYRYWTQAATNWSEDIWRRFGGETKPALNWRGNPKTNWVPGLSNFGFDVKGPRPNDKIDEEVWNQQAFCDAPRNSISIKPIETGIAKQVYLDDDQLWELLNIMGTNKFILKSGKKVTGVDGALLDLFNDDDYKYAAEIKDYPQMIDADRGIMLTTPETKKDLIRERYNYIKSQAIQILFHKNEAVRRAYFGKGEKESEQIYVPSMDIE